MKYTKLLPKLLSVIFIASVMLLNSPCPAWAAAQQPTAIFHAFNQQFTDVANFVCNLADQGYSHVQISPVQESNPGGDWKLRYQPFDYSKIDGLGNESQLKALIDKAHSCSMKVIADVVFNHMADLDDGDGFENLAQYPNLSAADFNTVSSNPGQRPCQPNYNDGNRNSEINCWLGTLPDLNFSDNVKKIQKAHLKMLLGLGIDGFRFDAAKHIPNNVVEEYINYINAQSSGNTWNYLEVITTDNDTKATDYNYIAAVTDFTLYGSLKDAFSFSGNLGSLPPSAVDDSRSVTFGQNHDTIKRLNNDAINPYTDETDSYLATAFVLARQDGTPLVFGEDNIKSPFIQFGVKFRQIMKQRQQQGKNVKETILRVFDNDSKTMAMMERGAEGFMVENKSLSRFDKPALDLTLSNLEGCYRELRRNFTVAIEKRDGNKKFVTRWGTWDRGGMSVEGRDALFFIREPFGQCQ